MSRLSIRVLAAIAVLGLVALAMTAALSPLSNNDIWLHLTTGRLVLEEGVVPKHDRYSFTAAGNRYVAHEWLAATAYALGERWGGVNGVIVVAKAIPTLAVCFGFVWAALVLRARPDRALLLAVLAFTVARHRILARPELIAIALLLATLALLWREREKPGPALWLLIPLQGIWANVHGSFPLGVGLTLLFAVVGWGDTVLDRGGRAAGWLRGAIVAVTIGAGAWLLSADPTAFGVPAALVVLGCGVLVALDGAHPLFRSEPSRGAPWRLLLASAGMGVAILANPRGAEIYLFPFEFTTTASMVTAYVHEWRPLLDPHDLVGTLLLPSYVAWLGVVACWLALAIARGSLQRLDLALTALLLLLPLRHGRWMALAALAVTPLIAARLGAVAQGPDSPVRRRVAGVFALLGMAAGVGSVVLIVPGAADPALLATWGVAAGCGLVALLSARRSTSGGMNGGTLSAKAGLATAACASFALAGLAVLHGIPEVAHAPRRPTLGIRVAEPIAAVAFLREHQIEGRLFTEYEWAGFSVHGLWPRVTVFLDSRSEVYPERIRIEYQQAMQRSRATTRILDEHDADLVMIPWAPYPARTRISLGAQKALDASPDWSLLYIDGRTVIYARDREGRRLPEPYRYLSPRRLRPGYSGLVDPGLGVELQRALERNPAAGVLRFGLALHLAATGRPEEARAEAGRAWQANPFYAASAQLAGDLAVLAGDLDAAREWFERARSVDPGWEAPKRALLELQP